MQYIINLYHISERERMLWVHVVTEMTIIHLTHNSLTPFICKALF